MISMKLTTASIRGISSLAANQISFCSPISGAQNAKPSIATSYLLETQKRSGDIGLAAFSTTPTDYSVLKPNTKKDVSPQVDLPVRPKKPPTPWILFVREKKDIVRRDNEHINVTEMAKILSREWRMSDKTPYLDEYSKMQAEYRRMKENYEESLTDEQRNFLDAHKALKRETKALKAIRQSNFPTMPRNAPNLYAMERCQMPEFKNEIKHRKSSEVFRDMFKEYKKMSQTEKLKYLDLQAKDRERFEREFYEWYKSFTSKPLPKSVKDQVEAIKARLQARNLI